MFGDKLSIISLELVWGVFCKKKKLPPAMFGDKVQECTRQQYDTSYVK